MTIREIDALLSDIDARQAHYQQLRALAAGGLVAGVDKSTGRFVYAGSIASDIVGVLEASLVGRVDLRVDPQDDIADALITELYQRDLHPLVKEAVRDFVVLGWGGIVVTPWGPKRLKPESASFIGREGYIRRYSMPVVDARRRFGNRKVFYKQTGDVTLVEVLQDRVLETWYGQERLERRDWDYRPRFLFGDERPTLLDEGLKGAPIGIVESCQDLFYQHYRVSQAIAMKSARAGVVQVAASQLEDPESAENIALRWDVVAVRDQPAVYPLEDLSLVELLNVRAAIEQQIASRSGVTPFQRGLTDPRVTTATEAALLQSQSGTRTAYMLSETRDWLNSVVGDFRRYLVWLPAEEQEAVEIPYQGTMHVFGAGRPYGDVLAGKLVTVALAGFQDILQRQQEIQALLPVVMGAGWNAQPLLEEYIRLTGRDPKLLMPQQS